MATSVHVRLSGLWLQPLSTTPAIPPSHISYCRIGPSPAAATLTPSPTLSSPRPTIQVPKRIQFRLNRLLSFHFMYQQPFENVISQLVTTTLPFYHSLLPQFVLVFISPLLLSFHYLQPLSSLVIQFYCENAKMF